MLKKYFSKLTPEDALEEISKINKNVVTFVGYSNEYFNEKYLINTAFSELDKLDRGDWVVNIGVTDVGIGAIYKLASDMVFETCGIASQKAL